MFDKPASGPIFSQPWWLDAVAPNSWDEVVISSGQRIVARLPYVINHRYGLTMLTMPPLTQALGPWIAPSSAKYTKQLSTQHELMMKLIEGLPRFDLFAQNFHHSITNCLPFYWHGFEQTCRYTYILDELSNLENTWNDLKGSIRTSIRKAEKQLTVRDDLGLDQFMRLNELTFQRQGLGTPYTRELVLRLDEACLERQCRKILFAEDVHGRPHAAVYIVWDQQSIYYLMSGSDPDLRNSDAATLLIWNAIQLASSQNKKFDFEGSMIKPIENFFRAFGAKQNIYFQVTRTDSLALKTYRDVRSLLHRAKEYLPQSGMM